MFYFKAKKYDPEGLPPQEVKNKSSEENKI